MEERVKKGEIKWGKEERMEINLNLSLWKIKVLAKHKIFQGLFSDEVGPSFTKLSIDYSWSISTAYAKVIENKNVFYCIEFHSF